MLDTSPPVPLSPHSSWGEALLPSLRKISFKIFKSLHPRPKGQGFHFFVTLIIRSQYFCVSTLVNSICAVFLHDLILALNLLFNLNNLN
jgi:hypothetical protein